MAEEIQDSSGGTETTTTTAAADGNAGGGAAAAAATTTPSAPPAPPAPPATPATPPASATVADVERIVRAAMKGVNEQAALSAEAQLKRSAVADRVLPGVPAIYRDLLPKTGDEAALTKAAEAIRDRFNVEFEETLKRHPRYGSIKQAWENTGGVNADGGTPAGKGREAEKPKDEGPAVDPKSPASLVAAALRAQRPAPAV